MYLDIGEVSEWSKEAVLKTVEPLCSGGSNPSLSATAAAGCTTGRGARVVESGSLLRSCIRKGTVGSNPTLSEGATQRVAPTRAHSSVWIER